MATFQPAGFNFGQNIVDADIRRAQLAAQREASARSAAIQARGQEIAAAENAARRAEQAAARDEQARQFDARMAESEAARAESARQFDAVQASKNREFAAKREDASREQSWNDALKTQQMELNEIEFAKRNEELNRIMAIRQKEDEERAHQQQMVESAYGDAVIAAELGGGFLSPGQINDFNKRNGTQYNYVGKVDPTTGEPFADGKLHFISYVTDPKTGQVETDPQSGRPLLNEDNPISAEFYGRVMDGYFGMYSGKSRGGTNGMSPERIALERERLEQRKAEEAGRNERAGAKANANEARIASSIAKDFGNIAMNLNMSDEQRQQFTDDMTQILTRYFGNSKAAPTASGGKAEVKGGDNSGDGTNTTRQEPPNGQYKVIRNGKPYHWGKSKSGEWKYFPDWV